MLPNHRLLARAFHRLPTSPSSSKISSPIHRRLSTTKPYAKLEGRQANEHVINEKDKHNVQHDASQQGKEERAKAGEGAGEGVSRGTSERSGGSNEKAREEFPEAPDTIGMQDERGGPNK